MDVKWSPLATRPKELYRICHPLCHTTYQSRLGLLASARKTVINAVNHPENLIPFYQTITDHRNQTPKQTPYISLFADRQEAENWALGAEDACGGNCRIMVISTRDMCMHEVVMFSVTHIMDKSGRNLGRGGVKDSEWLVCHYIPKNAIIKQYDVKEIRSRTYFYALFSSHHFISGSIY